MRLRMGDVFDAILISLLAGVLWALLCMFAFSATPARSPVWWISSSSTGWEQVYQGDTVYLHGVGLTAPAWVYLVNPAQKDFAAVLSVKDGEIQFGVPKWAPGVYDVWLWQGGWWSRCPVQLTLANPLPYSDQVQAPAPSGGDDTAALQAVFDAANPAGDQTGGPGTTVTLQVGSYKVSKSLNLVGHWGSAIKLVGQGRDKTTIKLTAPFTSTDGALMQGFLQDLTVDGDAVQVNRLLRSPTACVNCNFIGDQIFFDGTFNRRPVFKGCNITGAGIFANGPFSALIDGCNFYLDRNTEGANYLWSANNVRYVNSTVQNRNATNSGGRGRVVAFAYASKNHYLENLKSFNLAGTVKDTNCGEQILWDGDNTDPTQTVSNVYITNCQLQGDKTLTVGASAGFETWLPVNNLFVNGLTVDSCVAGFTFFNSPTGAVKNVTITNCRVGVRSFGSPKLVCSNIQATGCIEKDLWLEGSINLAQSSLAGAPIGVWRGNFDNSFGANSTLNLLDTTISGTTTAIDPSCAKATINLQGTSKLVFPAAP